MEDNCMEWIPVAEIFVSPSVLFRCLTCGAAIEDRQRGPYHRSSGGPCPQCGAGYRVTWDEATRQPTVEMEQGG